MYFNLQMRNMVMLVLVSILIAYYLIFPSSIYTSTYEAWLCILVSLLLTYKCRDSLPLFVGMIFITYCVYSIAIGEYIVGNNLAAPMLEIKNVMVYGNNIRILLLFLVVILSFLPKKINPVMLPEPKDNVIIYFGLIIILVIIGIYGINRVSIGSYSVSISPIYEYSSIIFLFAYYTSGNKLWRKVIIAILMILYILQDYYYGGRITSLQIMILALCTILRNKFTNIELLFFSFGGILLNAVVGAYRSLYNFDNINIMLIFNNLKTNLFVFDTPVYAFYASGTHIASIETFNIPYTIRLGSFINFFKSIFLGSNNNSGNVTLFVKENYFSNQGGGLFPTHFYFWAGWIGVCVASLIIVLIFNKLFSSKHELIQIMNVVIIATIPRWFIYNPLILFRTMFLVSVLYGVYLFFNKFIIISLKKT